MHCSLQQTNNTEARHELTHGRRCCTVASTTQHTRCHLPAARPPAACSILASMRVCTISCPGSPMTVNQRSVRLSAPRQSMSHRLGPLRVRLSSKHQRGWEGNAHEHRHGSRERAPRTPVSGDSADTTVHWRQEPAFIQGASPIKCKLTTRASGMHHASGIALPTEPVQGLTSDLTPACGRCGGPRCLPAFPAPHEFCVRDWLEPIDAGGA